MMTLADYQTTLTANEEPYAILPLTDDARILVTRRGGRILGLFAAENDHNLFWTHAALQSAHSFRTFLAHNDGWQWNLGGDRIWIAPEISYNVRDRRYFSQTWQIPAAMDPAKYELTRAPGALHLHAQMQLNAYQHGQQIGQVDLRLHKVIRSALNPLRDHPIMHAGVQYAGYRQSVFLAGQHVPSHLYYESWNLVQIRAGGTIILPITGAVQGSDYLQSAPQSAWNIRDGAVQIPLQQCQQFKVGYKAICMTGRIGYLYHLTDGRSYLLVRCFFNDPANIYAEEPPAEPGNSGHSVHIYHDSDDTSFSEIECAGHTLGWSESESTDQYCLLAYVGDLHAIRTISQLLLGCAP